mmetsp:Transcript_22912/g.54227  ORF Transcript_22912/g.54227 Transcript_22912/m.54227 type:complete len:428 (-) Transcript_22912:1125-2408(-)
MLASATTVTSSRQDARYLCLLDLRADDDSWEFCVDACERAELGVLLQCHHKLGALLFENDGRSRYSLLRLVTANGIVDLEPSSQQHPPPRDLLFVDDLHVRLCLPLEQPRDLRLELLLSRSIKRSQRHALQFSRRFELEGSLNHPRGVRGSFLLLLLLVLRSHVICGRETLVLLLDLHHHLASLRDLFVRSRLSAPAFFFLQLLGVLGSYHWLCVVWIFLSNRHLSWLFVSDSQLLSWAFLPHSQHLFLTLDPLVPRRPSVVARTREAAIGVFARPVSHVTVVRSVLAFVVVHARDPVIRAAPPRVARAREAVVGVGARCVQVTVVRSTGTLIRPGPVHRACHPEISGSQRLVARAREAAHRVGACGVRVAVVRFQLALIHVHASRPRGQPGAHPPRVARTREAADGVGAHCVVVAVIVASSTLVFV